MKASDIIGKIRFRRTSDSGGSGGGVSDLVIGSGAVISEKNYNTVTFQETKRRICLTDDLFISFTTTNPGGGSDSLVIKSQDNQTINSIPFNFGATYMWTDAFDRVAKISLKKDFVVIMGNGVNKVFVVPINKSGNDYSLGTPASFDLGQDIIASNIVFIDDTHFAVGLLDTNEIKVFEFANGEITLSKTITTTLNITYIDYANSKFLIFTFSSAQSNMEIIREDESSKSLTFNNFGVYNKHFSFGKYIVILTTDLIFSCIVDMEAEEIVEMDYSELNETGYDYSIAYCSGSGLNVNGDLVITRYGGTSKVPVLFNFNFTTKKVTKINIINNYAPKDLSGYGNSSFYYAYVKSNYFAIYCSSINNGDLQLFNDTALSLKYKGNTYNLAELGE